MFVGLLVCLCVCLFVKRRLRSECCEVKVGCVCVYLLVCLFACLLILLCLFVCLFGVGAACCRCINARGMSLFARMLAGLLVCLFVCFVCLCDLCVFFARLFVCLFV